MAVQLNHTIIWCSDKRASAHFLADILGVGEPEPFLHFLVVDLSNQVSVDFMEKDGQVSPQHYAFLMSDAEFDAAFARIEAAGIAYWADPARTKPGEINTHFGGRGVYFADPDGHLLEIITNPYDRGAMS
ncbi:VOC family protein [Parasphingopyxis marina]|uniref:VOC family protein n=1 Tax=Parasphingopyxis marina TaxID=2761622 RepID=A0A842I1G5_9SPHN|nr:VOC family protein [Parasphingopyxis marina]MBC2778591.1 VOC family protein [Parasphingopyxis marina]